jgi:hypothetical protein
MAICFQVSAEIQDEFSRSGKIVVDELELGETELSVQRFHFL